MPPVAENLPADTDLLCESCGYTLNGLPEGGLCPECGASILESTSGSPRTPPAWERRLDGRSRFGAFIETSREVLFHPGRFYRHTTTRSETHLSRIFARWHYLITSILLAIATTAHLIWYASFAMPLQRSTMQWVLMFMMPVTAGTIFVVMSLVTRLASFLTSIEAKYWGYRLPTAVVRRGLDYHAVHYLPVALTGVVVVMGYRVLLGIGVVDETSTVTYLYVLSGLVIASAGYLFFTYVIAMKRMMFANR
jgi:hypothetical protein